MLKYKVNEYICIFTLLYRINKSVSSSSLSKLQSIISNDKCWPFKQRRSVQSRYQRVNNLKNHNPELKTLLGVGGWMMGSKDFSRLAAGRGSRKVFARTTVKFLRDRQFDGLTIDWQHPTKRGGRPQDRENFSALLKVTLVSGGRG